MNLELKSMLVVVFDIVKLVEDAVAKKSIVDLFPGMYKLAADVPAVVQSWSDLMPEIQALSGMEPEADLVAFVVAQVAGVSGDEHAKKIVAAVLELAFCVGQKSYMLGLAIKG